MGDLNGEGDVLDEKLWGDDNSDDEPNAEDKKEEGPSISNPNDESQMVAKVTYLVAVFLG